MTETKALPRHFVFANRRSLFLDWCVFHNLKPNQVAYHITSFEQLKGLTREGAQNIDWHIIGDFDNEPLIAAAYTLGCPAALPKESPYS